MWWSAIPSFAIIGGLMTVPWYGHSLIHYAFTGRPTFRGLNEGTYNEHMQKQAYKRDWSMVGNEYESRGLDHIED